MSFWQTGTCVSFDFSNAPNEGNQGALSYCEGVNHNNWCANTVQLEYVKTLLIEVFFFE